MINPKIPPTAANGKENRIAKGARACPKVITIIKYTIPIAIPIILNKSVKFSCIDSVAPAIFTFAPPGKSKSVIALFTAVFTLLKSSFEASAVIWIVSFPSLWKISVCVCFSEIVAMSFKGIGPLIGDSMFVFKISSCLLMFSFFVFYHNSSFSLLIVISPIGDFFIRNATCCAAISGVKPSCSAFV